MKDSLIRLSVNWNLLKDARGQDIMEYALLLACVALAATAGMTTLAGNINSTFTTMGSDLMAAL